MSPRRPTRRAKSCARDAVADRRPSRARPCGRPASDALGAFRIVQEAVRNALRHAKAHHLLVMVRFEPAQLTVSGSDDGCGFAPEAWTKWLRPAVAAGTNWMRTNRGFAAAPIAIALLFLSSCATPSAPSGGPSRSVPAGWNSFVDPDHGWFTGYPSGWVVFTSANTHEWKNFMTDDPRIDRTQRSFRLQRGDGLLTVGVEEPAACDERAEQPGETQSTVAIAGRDVDMYHWNPPTSAGPAASEYAVRAVVNGQCYTIFLLFIDVPVETEDSVVKGVTTSFQFAG